MRLKRHYKTPDGWVKQVNEQGDCLNPPPLDYIEIQHTGTHPEQYFSVGLVSAGLSEGWLSIGQGKLTVHGQPEDLIYTIRRVPGEYPLKDGGREVIHHYDCILNDAQHARFCATTETARREAAYLLQGITPKRKAHVKEVARG